jgi:ABC-type sugar transport system ATPase subunit
VNRLFSIAVQDLTCDFPGVRALDNLNLEFRAGEIHALAGENGAGKSTLLKVLSGLIVPTRGEVAIQHTVDVCNSLGKLACYNAEFWTSTQS